jgi:hypothetical protein
VTSKSYLGNANPARGKASAGSAASDNEDQDDNDKQLDPSIRKLPAVGGYVTGNRRVNGIVVFAREKLRNAEAFE